MLNKVRVLIVGFGFMGQTHTGNVLRNSHAQVAGIVDTVSPVQKLASKQGNIDSISIGAKDVEDIPYFQSLDEALEKVQADAAVISLPTSLHFETVMKCLKHSLHVMVEKPFSVSLSECREMNRVAGEMKRILAVGYLGRYRNDHLYLKSTVQSCRLGKPKFLSFQRLTGLPDWGSWKDPGFVKASGGSLYDLMSHDIDIVRFLFGEPERIIAHPILCHEFQGNLVSAVMQYSQVNISVEAGFVSPSAFPFQRTFHAYFEHGTISVMPGMSGLREVLDNGEIIYPDIKANNAYYDEAEHFVRAISEEKPELVISSGTEAEKTIECCCEIQRQISKE